MCSTVVGTMCDGDCDIFAKGSNPYSVEETPEGDVCGVSGVIVLLHRYSKRCTFTYRCEVYAFCGISQ